MSDSLASWITLSALLASIAWYIYQSTERNMHQIVMSCATGTLCLFGGFVISGAIMKVTGSFDNAIAPALLVCLGTAICVAAHSLYRKKKAVSP